MTSRPKWCTREICKPGSIFRKHMVITPPFGLLGVRHMQLDSSGLVLSYHKAIRHKSRLGFRGNDLRLL